MARAAIQLLGELVRIVPPAATPLVSRLNLALCRCLFSNEHDGLATGGLAGSQAARTAPPGPPHDSGAATHAPTAHAPDVSCCVPYFAVADRLEDSIRALRNEHSAVSRRLDAQAEECGVLGETLESARAQLRCAARPPSSSPETALPSTAPMPPPVLLHDPLDPPALPNDYHRSTPSFPLPRCRQVGTPRAPSPSLSGGFATFVHSHPPAIHRRKTEAIDNLIKEQEAMRESLEKTRELAAKWELRCVPAACPGGDLGGVGQRCSRRRRNASLCAGGGGKRGEAIDLSRQSTLAASHAIEARESSGMTARRRCGQNGLSARAMGMEWGAKRVGRTLVAELHGRAYPLPPCTPVLPRPPDPPPLNAQAGADFSHVRTPRCHGVVPPTERQAKRAASIHTHPSHLASKALSRVLRLRMCAYTFTLATPAPHGPDLVSESCPPLLYPVSE